jgi:hypothetical protein
MIARSALLNRDMLGNTGGWPGGYATKAIARSKIVTETRC